MGLAAAAAGVLAPPGPPSCGKHRSFGHFDRYACFVQAIANFNQRSGWLQDPEQPFGFRM
jgi:hypothetical protein